MQLMSYIRMLETERRADRIAHRSTSQRRKHGSIHRRIRWIGSGCSGQKASDGASYCYRKGQHPNDGLFD